MNEHHITMPFENQRLCSVIEFRYIRAMTFFSRKNVKSKIQCLNAKSALHWNIIFDFRSPYVKSLQCGTRKIAICRITIGDIFCSLFVSFVFLRTLVFSISIHFFLYISFVLFSQFGNHILIFCLSCMNEANIRFFLFVTNTESYRERIRLTKLILHQPIYILAMFFKPHRSKALIKLSKP